MTVIVSGNSGGVTQLFNTETGRVTYKCKAESAFMPIEAFGGIVKFNQKGAMEVWVTSDKSHMPVLMKSEVKIGAVSVELIDYKRSE